MAKVKLLTKWNEYKKNDVIAVGDYTARQLCGKKMAEPAKADAKAVNEKQAK